MNRGFHGRAGLFGIGFGSIASGMGVSPYLLPPALYQLSPSPTTTAEAHSVGESAGELHTEVTVAAEYDP